MPGIDRYIRLANAIDWLVMANLVIKVPIVNSANVPLYAYQEESRFKLFMSDIGLLGAMSEIPIQSVIDYDFGTYKGYYAENFVAQELRAVYQKGIYCWQEKNSEIEFLLMQDKSVLPVEVKSGWITRAKSLQKFVDKYRPPYATIMSGHALKIDAQNSLHHYPLYLASYFPLS